MVKKNIRHRVWKRAWSRWRAASVERRPRLAEAAGSGRRMINFLARRDNLATIMMFMKEWAPDLAPEVQLFTYEGLPDARRLPSGLWIFGDVDRLEPAHRATAVAAWASLVLRHGDHARLLNRPGVSLPRRDLLHGLRLAGRNRFAVYDAEDWRSVRRFPVFIRHGTDHNGTLTPLLPDRDALARSLRDLGKRNAASRDLLIVEYLDTSTDGLFRKYSAFRIGETIVAHHVFHSRDWHVKASSLAVTPDLIAEEWDFQHTNPHLSELRELFDFARIDFGRMDYAMLDGRVQVWEINSNPNFLGQRALYPPEHLPGKLVFTETVVRLLRDLAERTA